ncbi:MAG: hypothetical protein N2254_06730, partial [bacterium]|nr:hypothetical protein [bacterium]
QAIEEGIEQGRKEGIEKGRKEGIEKGRKEGLREGLKEGFHKAIESLLVAKYGKRGRKLMSKIREIEKIDHLKKINIEIMKAKEFDNLVKKIDSITKNSK